MIPRPIFARRMRIDSFKFLRQSIQLCAERGIVLIDALQACMDWLLMDIGLEERILLYPQLVLLFQ